MRRAVAATRAAAAAGLTSGGGGRRARCGGKMVLVSVVFVFKRILVLVA